VPADDYTSFCGNGNANHHLQINFSVYNGMRSAVTKVKFVHDMSHIMMIMTVCWCDDV
jgi:hypothetical protein